MKLGKGTIPYSAKASYTTINVGLTYFKKWLLGNKWAVIGNNFRSDLK